MNTDENLLIDSFCSTIILTSGLAALPIRTYACQDSYQGSGHFKSDIELIKCNFSPLIDAHHTPLVKNLGSFKRKKNENM